MKLKVYNHDGGVATERDFAIPEFEGDKGRMALKQVLLAYMANRRQGNQSTKDQATVHGTGKKPFRQKGTGRARQGTVVGPQHYHGSKAHGPHQRDWSQKIGKQMRHLALRRALFERAVDGEVLVIEQWQLPERKTKHFDSLIGKIAPKGSVLVVDDTWGLDNALAARNIKRVSLNEARNLNAFDLSLPDLVILSEKAMQALLDRVNGGKAA